MAETRFFRPAGFALGALAGLAMLAAPAAVRAQDDVIALGARYGVTPPESYFALKASQPDAFTWDRAWINRNPNLEVVETASGPEVRERRSPDGPLLRSAGPESAQSVTGTVTFPLFLGVFAGGGLSPYTRAEVQAQFFDGPNPNGTIEDYYAEISGGRAQLVGETFDWKITSLSREAVTGGVSGLGGPSRVGEFITQLLIQHDQTAPDWGVYDNDGPDGIPNSGDDDGFVDVIAVMHTDFGGECGGAGSDDRIWSHRWSLRSATGQSFATSTESASGGPIRVNDYTIQPVLGCGSTNINQIGVFAHELGHGLGLPDLYAVDDGVSAGHQGAGSWDLMASGSYGCANNNSARPCHMGAWSKEFLGWGTFTDVPADTDLGTVSLPPVETTGQVLRVPIAETDEYYLIENRQPIGYDGEVLGGGGLMVWHIRPDVVAAKRRFNRVNSDPDEMGVRVVEADGRDNLRSTRGNRGDDGDPFPGVENQLVFHAGSDPATFASNGAPAMVTIAGITKVGDDMVFSLETTARTITVATEGAVNDNLATVDGKAGDENGFVVAPYSTVELAAADGDVIAEGVRSPFVEWGDGVTDRIRQVTVTEDLDFVARYGGQQVQVVADVQGGAFGVDPGRLVTVPEGDGGLWFSRGTSVVVTPEATEGFTFRDWTGGFAGQGQTLTLTMDDPVSLGAVFELTYGVDGEPSAQMAAGDIVDITLMTNSGAGPIVWDLLDGQLPPGLSLSSEGVISGTAVAVGTYSIDIRAADTQGLLAFRNLSLTVSRPDIPFSVLGATFIGLSTGPTEGQKLWIDRIGNNDSVYDLVDVRRYLLNTSGVASVKTTGSIKMNIVMDPPRETRDPGVGR